MLLNQPRLWIPLLLLGAAFAGFILSNWDPTKETPLPAQLQGTWTIISGEEDGKPLLFAREDTEDRMNRCILYQFIFTATQTIIVDCDGGGEVRQARAEQAYPWSRLHIEGKPTARDGREPMCLHFRLQGDKLTICSREDGQAPKEFTARKGSKQALLVLKRER